MYKGAITFGLVYIPVSLSASIKNNDIGFNMIEKRTMSRIKYKKTCVDCNSKEVKPQDIVKGYQYQKGRYVIFTDKDFEKLKSERDKNIAIVQFVNAGEVDPIYFDKSFYVSPVGADRAFCVLMAAMQKEGKAAIARTVLGTKEVLILLRAAGGTMLANTLYFYEEVQKAPTFAIKKTAKKEVDLACSLIDQMSKKFEPEKFKDEYNLRLKKAIKQKIAGNEIVMPSSEPAPSKVINIMEALQKSLKAERPKTSKKAAKT